MMWMNIYIMITCMIMSNIIMMLCFLVSKKTMNNKEKMSPFECGFDPKSAARLPFSIQFFMIAILFLIFDVEIVIILPMMINMKFLLMYKWVMIMFSFIMILLLGLMHEWKNGMIEWTK
nr:NADH dehydrogenase subunit 3 [Ceratocombus sp. HL-2012]